MRKFTFILILSLFTVSCQLSAATVADVKAPSCDVYLASNTHPYRVDVIAPDVSGGKAIQP
jgi:hypothetical protein